MKESPNYKPRNCLACLASVILLNASLVGAGQAAELPPLRDPAIVCAADGAYYLTGTTRINTLDPKFSDFQNVTAQVAPPWGYL